EIDHMKMEMDEARTFFWRNSRLMLDLHVEYMVITEFLPIERFAKTSWNGYWLPPLDVDLFDDSFESVESDLYDRGVFDDEYDGVIVFFAWGEHGYAPAYGGTTFGVDLGFLGHTGYTDIPMCWEPDTNSWYIIHEFNHQIDSMLDHAGYASFQHPDMPWTLEGDFGENYDYNAYFLRMLVPNDWLKLRNTRWGEIVFLPDVDADGVPDSGEVPITEDSIGSDATHDDSDADGLSDLKEVMAGIHACSDPSNNDTDGDGILDGDDLYPLYAIETTVAFGNFTIDPVIEIEVVDLFNSSRLPEFSSGNTTIVVLGSWDETGLNLIVNATSNIDRVVFDLDLANDGWFHGRDNVELTCFLDNGSMLNHSVKTWVCDENTIEVLGMPAWDNDPVFLGYFDRVLSDHNITSVRWTDGGTTAIKVHIPSMVETGDLVGILVKVHDTNHGGRMQWLFDENVFIDVILED
nr:hypothetical protein [Candidatus Sigynarchaeota archaeon]